MNVQEAAAAAAVARSLPNPPLLPDPSVVQVPRILWVNWFQGWDAAPEVARAGVQTWRHHNPNWDIRLLSNDNIDRFVGDMPLYASVRDRGLPPEALSDVLRIALLARYGGLWVDATTYCLKPLDAWLGSYLPSGFFAFDDSASDTLVSSWFIASAPEHFAVRHWCEKTAAYWEGRAERDEYFWLHRIFARSYHDDPRFRAVWDATPKLSRDAPHHYVPYDPKLWNPATEVDVRILAEAPTPLLKLTHKLRREPYPEDSALRFLIERAMVHAD